MLGRAAPSRRHPSEKESISSVQTYHFNEKALEVLLMPKGPKDRRHSICSDQSSRCWDCRAPPAYNVKVAPEPTTPNARATCHRQRRPRWIRLWTRCSLAVLHTTHSISCWSHCGQVSSLHDGVRTERVRPARRYDESKVNSPAFFDLAVDSFPTTLSGPSSSASSLYLQIERNRDVELELAIGMAPPQLTSAWAAKSYDASTYLRARTPYAKVFIDAMLAFHAHYDRPGAGTTSARGSPRWEYALDIGCGPGQLAIHLATRFDRVFGQDVSDRMLSLAKVTKQLDQHELAKNGLPAVEDPSRIEYALASGEDPKVPPSILVDAITLGACYHWLNWSTLESSRAIWTKWASLLRPGGSLFITGTRPVIGPFDGAEGERIKPLRDWLLSFWHNPSLAQYYDAERLERLHGPNGLYTQERMPWELEDEALARLWDPTDYAKIPFDDPSSELVCSDSAWLPESVRRATQRDDSKGELGVSLTTPRRQAEWVRSTSGYVKMLSEDVDQRIKAINDDDIVAVAIKRLCAEIGIGYEDKIECHNAGVVICLRRSTVEFEGNL